MKHTSLKICKCCQKEFLAHRTFTSCCSEKCRSKWYHIRFKDKIKIKRAKHYQDNIEKERANCKKWYQKNKESEIAKNKEYRKQNKELFDWYHNKQRFNGMRDSILERDKNQCCACGRTNDDMKLNVHHIDGKSYVNGYSLEEVNNSFSNLITLCNSCHHKLHHWQKKNHILSSYEDIVRTCRKLQEASGKN